MTEFHSVLKSKRTGPLPKGWRRPTPKLISANVIAQLADAYDRADIALDHCFDNVENGKQEWNCGLPYYPVDFDPDKDFDPYGREGPDWEVHEEAFRQQLRKAQGRYSDAIYACADYEIYKFEKEGVADDMPALWRAQYEASEHLDLILDMQPDFASRRELTDAICAQFVAAKILDVAEEKYDETPVVRTPHGRVSIVRTNPYGRKSKEKHL